MISSLYIHWMPTCRLWNDTTKFRYEQKHKKFTRWSINCIQPCDSPIYCTYINPYEQITKKKLTNNDFPNWLILNHKIYAWQQTVSELKAYKFPIIFKESLSTYKQNKIEHTLTQKQHTNNAAPHNKNISTLLIGKLENLKN